MNASRRGFIRSGLGVVACSGSFASTPQQYGMGLGTASYMQRGRKDRGVEPSQRFTDTLRFLEHCRNLGAAGIQAPLSSLEDHYAAQVRERSKELGMYLEVSGRLPSDDSGGLDLFEKTVQAARAAGASVIRTVMLSGRRYETFNTLKDWREFSRLSWKSLTWAEPILRKHGVRLGLENHKDWRIDEMLAILGRIDSEWFGVTVDTGNNMSLLAHV